MGLLKVEEVDNGTEELIIAGMITSSAFMSYISDRIDLKFIQNKQCQLLADLILEFFVNHNKAPEHSIKELLESVSDHVEDDEWNITEKLLISIDKKYGNREISFEVLKDTADEYFEKRSIEMLTDKLVGLTSRGRTEEAILAVDNWMKDPKRNKIKFSSLFDKSMAEAIISSDKVLFRFNNALDSVFPPQTSNKLYTFLGGTKSGKSQWLGSLAVLAMEAGLKVCFWQFELTATEFMGRLLSNISGKEIDSTCKENFKDTEISVWDCEHNRTGECQNPNRPNNTEEPNFDSYEESDWVPCTACRGLPEFSPVVWKEPFRMKVINSFQELKKEQETWERQFGDNIRLVCSDPGTIAVSDIKNQLDRLRLTEGFIPDVVIIDQADNLKSVSRYSDKRHEIGSIWLELSGLAKKGYLLWTASQTNRSAWGKEWIDPNSVGEDASKLMVCNGVITINQFKDDKFNEYVWNTQRLRALYFRGAKMPAHDIRTLNDFSRYIAFLDGELI